MEFYICPVCMNIVELVKNQGVPVHCCGTKMQLLKPNTQEAATEKHIPVVEVQGNILHVTVGEVLHPSLETHHIGFIAVKAGDLVIRRNLSSNEEPKATFSLGDYKGNVDVYAWCDLHGSWQTTLTI